MGQGAQPQQGPNNRPGPGGGLPSLAERVSILRSAIAHQEGSLVDLEQELAQIRGSNSPKEAEFVRKNKESQSEFLDWVIMAVYVPLFL